jgi:RNA 2',3'-cyclic 3'-phosphodiesterase
LTVVAKERLKSPRARLFVALDIPDEIRTGLVEWQRGALTDEALRVLSPEALHMTLVFLGWQRERDIDRIAELATGEIAAEAPEVRLLPDPVGVPPRGRPRLFAVDAESPGAIELQSEVERKLVDAGFYEPEKRAFWPHLTVARVRSERRPRGSGGKRRTGRYMHVDEPPGALPEALQEPFRAVRVALYRSILRPQGAEYASLAHVELPVRGSGKAS